jgi:cobalt-zinc-cadmium efflux system outer membrane protein
LVEVARDGEKAAEQAMEAADKRFQVGDASRLEINAARVERGRATQERSRAEQRAATALAELQLLLALPPEEPCIVRGELAVAPIDQPETLDALITRAAESRADIVAARFDLESARAESKLADRQWMPSPRFGAAFSHEEGADIVQGLVGVDLPTFNRNQAGRGAASARVLQADQALQAVRRRAEQEVRLADLRLRAAEQVSSAYASEVVSAMRENLDLGNRAYQAGQIDFTQLLLIRRESLEAQRGYVDALEELNSARSELDRAVGREMP